jgi:hypothetical protein
MRVFMAVAVFVVVAATLPAFANGREAAEAATTTVARAPEAVTVAGPAIGADRDFQFPRKSPNQSRTPSKIKANSPCTTTCTCNRECGIWSNGCESSIFQEGCKYTPDCDECWDCIPWC